MLHLYVGFKVVTLLPGIFVIPVALGAILCKFGISAEQRFGVLSARTLMLDKRRMVAVLRSMM